MCGIQWTPGWNSVFHLQSSLQMSPWKEIPSSIPTETFSLFVTELINTLSHINILCMPFFMQERRTCTNPGTPYGNCTKCFDYKDFKVRTLIYCTCDHTTTIQILNGLFVRASHELILEDVHVYVGMQVLCACMCLVGCWYCSDASLLHCNDIALPLLEEAQTIVCPRQNCPCY